MRLFARAVINELDGKVIGECQGRHRHQEWLKFLRRLDAEFLPESANTCAPQEDLPRSSPGTELSDLMRKADVVDWRGENSARDRLSSTSAMPAHAGLRAAEVLLLLWNYDQEQVI
jgi:hypothetical protein